MMIRNRLKDLRRQRGWKQEYVAIRMNEVMEEKPYLKKITKSNPEGKIDQQTYQKLETGAIDLTSRYLWIFSEVYDTTPNYIMGL